MFRITKKILIIDNDKNIRMIYRKLLIREGYEVIEAPGAVEANEILKNNLIGLILLDIVMPEVDGIIFFQVIRMFHRKAKVIVIGIYSLDEQERMIPGADGYFDKSQGIKVLLSKVKGVLNEKDSVYGV